MLIIDAKDLILGRLASFVAKQAILGETIHVVNAELAVITGDKRKTIDAYKRRRTMGAPLIGPFFPRSPDMIVKRCIRGMVGHKTPKGKTALARVKCYVGVPASLKNEEVISFDNMNVEKTHAPYITIREISKELGAKKL